MNFIHRDFTDDRRILSWVRELPAAKIPWSSSRTFPAKPPGDEYRVPGWPSTPPGRRWREVSQARDVPNDWIGRKPLFPWEAKTYTLA